MAEVPGTIVDDPKRPWKAIVALAIPILITALQLIQTQFNDGTWTSEDTWTVVIGVLGAVGVYLTPNPKTFANGLNVRP